MKYHTTVGILTNLSAWRYLKVEYHTNENPLKHSDKMAYIDQRLMYPINKTT